VDAVYNGEDALSFIETGVYDALVLDIMMPGMDGIEVLRRAREMGCHAPALFLTAKADVESRVQGLNAGADDYLPKPFSTAELLARVKALVRRSDTYVPDVIACGNTRLDCSRYLLEAGRGNTHLNNKEFQLLELFMRYPGRVFSSEYLMEKIWSFDADAGIDTIWTYIGFLRKKLKSLGSDLELRTNRGAGYSLEKVG